MESIEITYFRSSLCPNMLFDSKEDANNFDEILKRYSESPEAKSKDTEMSDEELVTMLRERGYSGELTKKILI